MSLLAMHQTSQQFMRLADPEILDIVMATVVANRLPGNPVWLILISPPSNGKTEILSGFRHVPNTRFITTLTKNSLMSGFKTKDGREPSLLAQLTDATLIVKDLGSIMNLHPDERNKVFSDLRDVFDGNASKPFGTGKAFEWTGKMGLVGAATPAYDKHTSLQTLLGERFVLARIHTPATAAEEEAQTLLALEVNGKELAHQQAYQRACEQTYQEAITRFASLNGSFGVGEEGRRLLTKLAALTCLGRASVWRDYRKEVVMAPFREGPHRVAKQYIQLVLALALIRGRNAPAAEDFATIRKIARDSFNPWRLRTLHLLYKHGIMTSGALAKELNLPWKLVEVEMEDAQLHNTVRREEHVGAWLLQDEMVERFESLRFFEGLD